MKNFNRILVLDIGGTYTKHCIVESDKIIEPNTTKTVRGEGFLNFINALIANYTDFDCISIGFCGIVLDKDKLYSENLGIDNVSLKDFNVSVPIFAANDVFCSALTALDREDIKEKQLVFVMIGTSIAVSLVHKGTIITGKNNMFGEVIDLDLELGNKFLKQHNLDSFDFLNDQTSEAYKIYTDKTKRLIDIITAVLSPDEIIFGGGVVFHEWNESLRKTLIDHSNTLFKFSIPAITYLEERDYRNIKGVSMLPIYKQQHE